MTTADRPFAGETFRFGFCRTELGLAAVAKGERGVVAIFLGSDRNRLQRQLGDALAGAMLVPDDEAIGGTLKALRRAIDAPGCPSDLRLDLRGGAGELAVWQALRAIPPGETRTYGAIAKAIGAVLTAQEVGAACAANRVAVAVPCHRVIKADGSLSGYRWGVERKRQLLAMEAA